MTEYGYIDSEGRLRLPKGRIEDYLSQHREMRAIVSIEAVCPHTSKALQSYYNRVAVPAIADGFYKRGTLMTKAAAEAWVRSEYPLLPYNEDGTMKNIYQMTQEEAVRYIEWLKQYCAENLETYIEDPRVI